MTQNKKATEDLRVRRTRKMLMQALIELTIEKGFSAVSVQDIADRAMINRATFYRHYVDKHDLLERYMSEVYELTASQEELAFPQTKDAGSDSTLVGMASMFEEVYRHADFYRVMLGVKGDPAFVQRVRQFSEMRLRSLLPDKTAKTKTKGPPVDLCLSFLSHAGIGVMAWWLSEGQSYSPTQIAIWANQLTKATVELVLGKANDVRH